MKLRTCLVDCRGQVGTRELSWKNAKQSSLHQAENKLTVKQSRRAGAWCSCCSSQQWGWVQNDGIESQKCFQHPENKVLKILNLLWKSQPESQTLDESVVHLRWRQNTSLGLVINQLQSFFFKGRDHFWKAHTYKLGSRSLHSCSFRDWDEWWVLVLTGTRVWGRDRGMLSAPFWNTVPD